MKQKHVPSYQIRRIGSRRFSLPAVVSNKVNGINSQRSSKIYENLERNERIGFIPKRRVSFAPQNNHLQQKLILSLRSDFQSLSSIPEQTDNQEDDEVIATEDIEETHVVINDPAPNGGYGWIIVLSAFLSNFIVDGVALSFGIFLDEFVTYFNTTKAKASLVGSLLSGVYLSVGPLLSALVNRFGCRCVSIIGGIISFIAFILSAFAPNIETLIFTYGVIGGIGMGFIYLPAIVSVGYYFTTKRAFATGIAVSGSGMGAFLLAPLLQFLLNLYDWKNCLIILAALTLNGVVCGALMRPLNIYAETVITDNGRSDSKSSDRNEQNNVSQCQTVLDNNSKNELLSQNLNNSNPNVNFQPQTLNIPQIEEFQDSHYYYEKHSMGVQRSISDYTPELQVILSNDLPSEIENGSLRKYGHRHSIFVRPMYKTDIFYSNNSHQLSSDSNMQQLDDSSIDIDPSLMTGVVTIPAIDILEVQNQFNQKNLDKNIKERNHVCCSKVRSVLSKINKTESLGLKFKVPPSIKDILNEMFDFTLLIHNKSFRLLALANVLSKIGFSVPFVYIMQYAMFHVRENNELLSIERAATLISVFGITNIIGRLMFGWISDYIIKIKIFGRRRITALLINNICLFLCGISTIVLPFCKTYSLLMINALFFGLFYSACVCLTSIILTDLLGLENLTNSFGLLILFRGISSMFGPPLAGVLFDLTESYHLTFSSAGIMLLLASMISCMITNPIDNDNHKT